MKKQTVLTIVCLLLAVAAGYFFLNKQSSPAPETQNLESRKTVEDYFVENIEIVGSHVFDSAV